MKNEIKMMLRDAIITDDKIAIYLLIYNKIMSKDVALKFIDESELYIEYPDRIPRIKRFIMEIRVDDEENGREEKLTEEEENFIMERVKLTLKGYKEELNKFKGERLRSTARFYLNLVYPVMIQDLDRIENRDLAQNLKNKCDELAEEFKKVQTQNREYEKISPEIKNVPRWYIRTRALLEEKLKNGTITNEEKLFLWFLRKRMKYYNNGT